MKFTENVDSGPKKRWLKFGDVLDSGGAVGFAYYWFIV